MLHLVDFAELEQVYSARLVWPLQSVLQDSLETRGRPSFFNGGLSGFGASKRLGVRGWMSDLNLDAAGFGLAEFGQN